MDDLSIAKALIERLTREQLSELVQHIETIVRQRYASSAVAVTAPPTVSDRSSPGTGLTIEFCESTAGTFRKALSLAELAPHYSTVLENKKTWHRASWPELNLLDSLALVNSLSSLRNKRCFINGIENDWSELFGFSNCAGSRSRAYRPDHYCFGGDTRSINPWGCLHSRMDWSPWANWFSYGHFTRAGFLAGGQYGFSFDKARIRHELENNLFSYRFCPHMKTKLIDAVLNSLPDQIVVGKSPDWGYRESYNAAPGLPKITERETHDGYTTTNEFYADGVKPIGLNALRTLMKKAFKEAKLPDSLLLSLVR